MPLIERSKTHIYPFISPSANLKGSVNGKTILITGAGTGIGKSNRAQIFFFSAIARQFALAGAETIIICGRRMDPLLETKSAIIKDCHDCAVQTITVDVTEEASVQSLFEEILELPDVLINNAGLATFQTVVDSDTESWWKDYETNVKGVYLCTKAYLRALDGKPGRILNVSSNSSFSPSKALSSYCSAKAALNRLTEITDMENSNRGVRCIAFHPGGVSDTVMGKKAPDYLQKYLVDTADLPGGTAVYLSLKRADFLGGRFVVSNWDMEELEKLKDKIVAEDLLKMRISMGGDVLGTVLKED